MAGTTNCPTCPRICVHRIEMHRPRRQPRVAGAVDDTVAAPSIEHLLKRDIEKKSARVSSPSRHHKATHAADPEAPHRRAVVLLPSRSAPRTSPIHGRPRTPSLPANYCAASPLTSASMQGTRRSISVRAWRTKAPFSGQHRGAACPGPMPGRSEGFISPGAPPKGARPLPGWTSSRNRWSMRARRDQR